MIYYWQLKNGRWTYDGNQAINLITLRGVWGYDDYRMCNGERIMVAADAMRYYPA